MSRKYRQPGYQDSGADHNGDSRGSSHSRGPSNGVKQQLTPEERIQQKSLRRATAREANEVVRCHNCGSNVQHFGAIATESVCPRCSTPLHCCRTCVSFDTSSRWQCRAEITGPVAAKSDANLCPQYQPRLVLDATGRRSTSISTGQSMDPKAQFENLFKFKR